MIYYVFLSNRILYTYCIVQALYCNDYSLSQLFFFCYLKSRTNYLTYGQKKQFVTKITI